MGETLKIASCRVARSPTSTASQPPDRRATRRIGTSDPVAPEIARRGARVARGAIGRSSRHRKKTRVPRTDARRVAREARTSDAALAVALGLGGPDIGETHFASEGGRVWFGATRKGRRRAQPRRRRAGGTRAGDRDGRNRDRLWVLASRLRNPESTSQARRIIFQACSNPSETDAARCSSTLPTLLVRALPPSLRGAPRGRRARSPRALARVLPRFTTSTVRPTPRPPFSREASASARPRARDASARTQVDARRPSPLTSSSPLPQASSSSSSSFPSPAATCRVPWTSPTSVPRASPPGGDAASPPPGRVGF